MSSRKLYKNVKMSLSIGSMSDYRRQAIAWSNNYLCLPTNEKRFNFDRIRSLNHWDKHISKSDYNFKLLRHGESDRKKAERRMVTKKLRRELKRKANEIIEEELSNNF